MNTGKFEKLSEYPNGYGLKIFVYKIELTNNKDVLKLGASLFIPIASPLPKSQSPSLNETQN